MYIIRKKPPINMRDKLIMDYYDHYEKINGKSKLRTLSLFTLKYTEENHPLFKKLDPNYELTKNKIDMVYSQDYENMIRIISDYNHNNVIGYTTYLIMAGENETTISVDRIVLKDEENFLFNKVYGNRSIAQGMYYQFIKAIEEASALIDGDVKILFSDVDESELFNCLSEMGYFDSPEGVCKIISKRNEEDYARSRIIKQND